MDDGIVVVVVRDDGIEAGGVGGAGAMRVVHDSVKSMTSEGDVCALEAAP